MFHQWHGIVWQTRKLLRYTVVSHSIVALWHCCNTPAAHCTLGVNPWTLGNSSLAVGSVRGVCWLQASTVAAGVNAYLIKTDISKLSATDMAHYVEDRIGNTITTAWNLNVKDVEQTISGVCNKVSSPCGVGDPALLCGAL